MRWKTTANIFLLATTKCALLALYFLTMAANYQSKATKVAACISYVKMNRVTIHKIYDFKNRREHKLTKKKLNLC